MNHNFIYEGLPNRVVFGQGKLFTLPAEAERLGVKRILVLSSSAQVKWAEEVAHTLGNASVGVFSQATMHTPVEVSEQAVAYAKSVDADCVLGLGGGSTIGLGKAIALRTGLPQIAVPTTYAGSEMTPILGETKDGVKTTQRTMSLLPKTVIYDVNLSLSLPMGLSATSGLNAMAHAVEALYSQDRNPITSLYAEGGIAALGRALPILVKDAANAAARADALYGAWLCGICLGSAGMALHHKLCHVLGGAFDLPHSEMHAVMLPHTVAYNMHAAADVISRAARALQTDNAALGFWELGRRIAAPSSLRELGMPESGIDHAVALALKNPYWNPEPLQEDKLKALITRAWWGDAPV